MRVALVLAFAVLLPGCLSIHLASDSDLVRRVGVLEEQHRATAAWADSVVEQGNDQENRLKTLESKEIQK